MTEIKRDLHADLAICNAAQSGPWKVGGGKFGETNVYAGDIRIVRDIDYDKQADATFITEARTGWPHAIERAISAETELAEETRMVERLVASQESAVARARNAERERDQLRAGIAAAMTYPPGIIRAKLRKVLEAIADGA
jgi:hypothetical protein